MRLALYGIIAVVAVVGTTAYDQYDKKTNYQPVNARVSAVTDQCYMEKVDRGAFKKTTSTSDLIRCELAEALVREHPKWQGYSIKHKIVVRIAYFSPVDGASHESSLTKAAFSNGPLHAGDVIQVLASKTKPDQTREP